MRVASAAARAHAGRGPGPARSPTRSCARSTSPSCGGSSRSCPGDHVTPQVGAGTELALIRPYQPGDDVRHIDWNVTARMREPHVRVHVGERAMTAWLMLDVSPSMSFGTALRRKADVAEGVSLADRPRRDAARQPARRGRLRRPASRACCARARAGSGCSGLLAELRGEPAADGGGRDVARRGDRAGWRRSPARAGSSSSCPTSAARATGRRGLRSLRARHGVLAVEVRDPRELELPPVGDVWMVDPETGRQIVVNTSRRKVRKRFKAAAAAEREEVAAALRRAGADHLVLSTDGDWLRDLAGHLRRAEQVRRGAMAAGGPGARGAPRARRRAPARAGAPTRDAAPRPRRGGGA